MTTPHRSTQDPADRAVESILDACAVVLGLGVMAVNRFQAVRRQVSSTDAPAHPGDGADERSDPTA
jgi:hypothetical protein